MTRHPYVLHYDCYSCRRCRLVMWWRYNVSQPPGWHKTAGYYLARGKRVPRKFGTTP